MNQQEMFNIVWEHAKKKQWATRNGACAYRGDGGSKCFIGACIKDEDYDPSFDGSEYSTAFEDLIRNHPIMREYFKDIPIQFGTELQDIHDSTTPGLWEARLITFAKTWELNIPA